MDGRLRFSISVGLASRDKELPVSKGSISIVNQSLHCSRISWFVKLHGAGGLQTLPTASQRYNPPELLQHPKYFIDYKLHFSFVDGAEYLLAFSVGQVQRHGRLQVIRWRLVVEAIEIEHVGTKDVGKLSE